MVLCVMFRILQHDEILSENCHFISERNVAIYVFIYSVICA